MNAAIPGSGPAEQTWFMITTRGKGTLDGDGVSAALGSWGYFALLYRVRPGDQGVRQALSGRIGGLIPERHLAVAICRKRGSFSERRFQHAGGRALLDIHHPYGIGARRAVIVRRHGPQTATSPGGCVFTHHWRRAW
jgi:hypothetical protein